MKVTQKQFVAWAKALPKDANFKFWRENQCPIARFLQEAFNDSHATYLVSSGWVLGQSFLAPRWMSKVAMALADVTPGMSDAITKSDVLCVISETLKK